MLIHGTVFLYNENEKTQEIGLLNATVLNSETGDALWVMNFIYLSKEYGKMVVFENYIEFNITKNQTPKTTSMPTFDGRQVKIQDGLQMATNGTQVISEGLQMVAKPQQGNQTPRDGSQTSAPSTSQDTFAPASGPRIPPMKNNFIGNYFG